MTLYEWARKWDIPLMAVEDLRAQFGLINTDPKPLEGASEAAIQNRIRLEASRKEMRLWRNNVGAVNTEDGIYIRYGLVNDSKALNSQIKSSDLIGIRPLLINSKMIGSTVGQFMAVEVKESNWVYKGTAREKAQLKFLELVKSLGGWASFVNREGVI